MAEITAVRPPSSQITAVRPALSKLCSRTPRRPVRRDPDGASTGSPETTVWAIRRPARSQKAVSRVRPSTVSRRPPVGVHPAREA